MNHISVLPYVSKAYCLLKERLCFNQIHILVAWLSEDTWGKIQIYHVNEIQEMTKPEVSTERKNTL